MDLTHLYGSKMKYEGEKKKQPRKDRGKLIQKASNEDVSEAQRMRAVLESLSDPILVINNNQKIEWMNRAAYDLLLGISCPLKTMLCYECFHKREAPCDDNEEPCPMKRVSDSGKPVTIVHEHYRADGLRRLYEITATPLWSQDGTFQGIVESMRDITEHRRVEQERESLITELQKSLSEIKVLKGLIPICAWCKKVRNDKGYWEKVEKYIEKHSDARFTHGICNECLQKIEKKEHETGIFQNNF